MSEYSAVFGIDSHARTTTVCAIVVETGETASWVSSFPGPRMGVVRGRLHRLHTGAHALRRRHARGADSHPLHAHEPRGQGEEDRPDGRRQARQGGACRRSVLERGVAARKANAATAAEMARWLWAVGLEAQRAARA